MKQRNMLISYNPDKPEQKYELLNEKIKVLGSSVKINQSVWYVSTKLNVVEVSETLNFYVDKGDVLLVTEMYTASWLNLDEKIASFITEHWNN